MEFFTERKTKILQQLHWIEYVAPLSEQTVASVMNSSPFSLKQDCVGLKIKFMFTRDLRIFLALDYFFFPPGGGRPLDDHGVQQNA